MRYNENILYTKCSVSFKYYYITRIIILLHIMRFIRKLFVQKRNEQFQRGHNLDASSIF